MVEEFNLPMSIVKIFLVFVKTYTEKEINKLNKAYTEFWKGIHFIIWFCDFALRMIEFNLEGQTKIKN